MTDYTYDIRLKPSFSENLGRQLLLYQTIPSAPWFFCFGFGIFDFRNKIAIRQSWHPQREPYGGIFCFRKTSIVPQNEKNAFFLQSNDWEPSLMTLTVMWFDWTDAQRTMSLSYSIFKFKENVIKFQIRKQSKLI